MHTPDPQRPWLTRAEAADYLRFKPRTVTSMIRRGELAAELQNGQWRIRPEDLYVQSQRPAYRWEDDR